MGKGAAASLVRRFMLTYWTVKRIRHGSYRPIGLFLTSANVKENRSSFSGSAPRAVWCAISSPYRAPDLATPGAPSSRRRGQGRRARRGHRGPSSPSGSSSARQPATSPELGPEGKPAPSHPDLDTAAAPSAPDLENSSTLALERCNTSAAGCVRGRLGRREARLAATGSSPPRRSAVDAGPMRKPERELERVPGVEALERELGGVRLNAAAPRCGLALDDLYARPRRCARELAAVHLDAGRAERGKGPPAPPSGSLDALRGVAGSSGGSSSAMPQRRPAAAWARRSSRAAARLPQRSHGRPKRSIRAQLRTVCAVVRT